MQGFFEKAQINAIHGQLLPEGVVDLRVLDAFKKTPRHLFFPRRLIALSYADEAVPYVGGGFVMPPVAFAKILQRLHVLPTDAMLFLGGGFGCEAAMAARLAASVIVLESESAYSSSINQRFYDLGLRNAFILNGADYMSGHPSGAPYNVIFCNSTRLYDAVPDAVVPQLAEGGRLVYFKRAAEGVASVVTVRKDAGGAMSCVHEERCHLRAIPGGDASGARYGA
ncbi:MAG: hypothetical protein ABW189_09350 [Rickettsiales bacterium]